MQGIQSLKVVSLRSFRLHSRHFSCPLLWFLEIAWTTLTVVDVCIETRRSLVHRGVAAWVLHQTSSSLIKRPRCLVARTRHIVLISFILSIMSTVSTCIIVASLGRTGCGGSSN